MACDFEKLRNLDFRIWILSAVEKPAPCKGAGFGLDRGRSRGGMRLERARSRCFFVRRHAAGLLESDRPAEDAKQVGKLRRVFHVEHIGFVLVRLNGTLELFHRATEILLGQNLCGEFRVGAGELVATRTFLEFYMHLSHDRVLSFQILFYRHYTPTTQNVKFLLFVG